MSTSSLQILAGKEAFSEIKENGLSPDRIKLVLGASGGPKWLVLSRLDQYLSEHFLAKTKHPISLMGSSIGAWRMAVYACSDPHIAFKQMENLNFTQRYSTPIKSKEVQEFVDRVIAEVYTKTRTQKIVHNPLRKLNIIAVRSRRLLNSRSKSMQLFIMALAGVANIFSASLVPLLFPRVIVRQQVITKSEKNTQNINLDENNLAASLIASGTIPMIMDPVTIPGGKKRWYWDGAISDYHFSGPFDVDDGLILYPHFSSKVVPGWFDKILPWRKPKEDFFSKVVMLVPSDEFIAQLPFKKIPDRTDFDRYSDNEREQYWKTVLIETDTLVKDFHKNLEKDGCRSLVKPLVF
jgi:hypothetical protein